MRVRGVGGCTWEFLWDGAPPTEWEVLVAIQCLIEAFENFVR
jgi:hypothetical protein